MVNEIEAKKWTEARNFTYWEVSAKDGKKTSFEIGNKNVIGTNIESMFEDILQHTVGKGK